MSLDILASLVTVAVSALASGVLYPLVRRVLGLPHPVVDEHQVLTPSYSDQVHTLTDKLSSITMEAEKIISEMSEVVQDQETRRTQLLEEVTHLTQQEAEMKSRLEQMSKEDIVGQLIAQERRHEAERKEDARHDRFLFLLGVGVTTFFTFVAVVFAIATHHLGWT